MAKVSKPKKEQEQELNYNQLYYRRVLKERRKKQREELKKQRELNPVPKKPKVCPICETKFTPKHGNSKYCCEACKELGTKIKHKIYLNSEKGKQAQQKYMESEKYKKAKENYLNSEKWKEMMRKYRLSEKGREAFKRYAESEKGKEARKRAYLNYRKKVKESKGE